MGKNKFIDKKNASTFQLIARDTSDPNYDDSPGGDRCFIQVSGRQTDNAESIFADAPEDEEGDHYFNHAFGNASSAPPQPLSEAVRKEILDLGFPDDGYNYLNHLRDIKNTGGGCAYYPNPKAKLEQLPDDVRAYDASKLKISGKEVPDEKDVYTVAAKTRRVRTQKAIDPEVDALLYDSDAASRFGDDEAFEEDFVVQANLPDGDEEEEEEDEDVCVGPSVVEQLEKNNVSDEAGLVGISCVGTGDGEFRVTYQRARRDVDDEFDMILSREYDNDDDDEDDYNGGDDEDGYFYGDEEHASIEEKLRDVKLNDCMKDDFELSEYEVPGDEEQIQKTKKLGKMYENEDQEDVVVIVEESSDESEKWDCETVVTTYSTLENHPAKIGAPELSRKKKQHSESVFKGLDASNTLIKLGGKQRLPVDFLPGNRKPLVATEKVEDTCKAQQQQRKQHGQESKEEKKERKTAVKEERREARRAKKELKELYKGEAHHAQRIAAISGPSSKRLM